MIVIRNAFIHEYETISRFQELMAMETEGLKLNPQTVRKGVCSVFSDPAKGKYFVAADGDAIAGSLLTTYEWSDWRNMTVIWIQSVYVSPEYRGKGLFKQMFGHIKDIVKESGDYAGIRLYVDKENHVAREVYRKTGMNPDHYELFEWIRP